MTGAWPLVGFVILTLFVWAGQPYGPLPITALTSVGMIMFGCGAAFLLSVKPVSYDLKIRSPRPLQLLIAVTLPSVPIWLSYIIKNYGYPPAYYSFIGQPAPLEILNAKYRDALPLKSLFPPYMISLSVATLLLTIVRRKLILTLVTLALTFIFVSVYDTRHVILWIMIYIGLAFFMFTQNLLHQLKKVSFRMWIVLITVCCLGWSGFVALGNIRTTMSSDTSVQFATAMGFVYPYNQMPLSAIWAVLYMTSGIARGMVQDDFSDGLAFNLPPKMFPGFMQTSFAKELLLEDEFAGQNFNMNAWHSYVLWFGFGGACLLTFGLFVVLFTASRSFQKSLAAGKTIPGVFAAFLLWLWVRAALLPIADYLIDFSGLMELLFLCVLFHIGGVTFEPVDHKRSKAKADHLPPLISTASDVAPVARAT